MSRFFRRPEVLLGGLGIVGICFLALGAGLVAPADPLKQSVSEQLMSPSLTHLLGTDFFGRDVFSRLVWGARQSLLVGIVSVGLAMFMGVALGLIAAVLGRAVESVIMRACDVAMSFPDEVLGVMIGVATGFGLHAVIIAIALAMTPRFIRLVHGPAKAILEREFISAARAIGVRDAGIVSRHVFPNLMGEVLVMGVMWIGTAIRIEANLSFLGLGIAPPTPTWGNMIREGLEHIGSAWWISVAAGAAIFVTIIAFNLVGDALRDVIDPATAP